MIKTVAGDTVGTKFLRIADVCDETGMRPSTIYAYVAAGKFPKMVKLGPRCSGWFEPEVTAWKAERIAERDQVAT